MARLGAAETHEMAASVISTRSKSAPCHLALRRRLAGMRKDLLLDGRVARTALSFEPIGRKCRSRISRVPREVLTVDVRVALGLPIAWLLCEILGLPPGLASGISSWSQGDCPVVTLRQVKRDHRQLHGSRPDVSCLPACPQAGD